MSYDPIWTSTQDTQSRGRLIKFLLLLTVMVDQPQIFSISFSFFTFCLWYPSFPLLLASFLLFLPSLSSSHFILLVYLVDLFFPHLFYSCFLLFTYLNFLLLHVCMFFLFYNSYHSFSFLIIGCT